MTDAEFATLFRNIVSGQMPYLVNDHFDGLNKIRDGAFPRTSKPGDMNDTVYSYLARFYGSGNDSVFVFPESLSQYGYQWYLGIINAPTSVTYPTTLTTLNGLLCGTTSTTLNSTQITSISGTTSTVYGVRPVANSTLNWNVVSCVNGDASHIVVAPSTVSGSLATEYYINIVLGNMVTNIPDYFLDSTTKCNDSFTIPSSVTTIGKKSLPKDLTSLTIPSSVSTIRGALKVTNANTLTTIRFEQPANMSVSLPTAGSVNGMCYYKSSYNVTIYTDNATIKNYAWSTDNVTATFKHLDGTSW